MKAEALEVFLTFLRFGLLSFGGGMTNLPEMARTLLAQGWLTEREFVDGFALGQFVPGPNMLAVLFYGLKAAGWAGALAAGAGMFLPGAFGALLLAQATAWMERARWSRALARALVPIGLGLSAGTVLTLVELSVRSLLEGGIVLASLWALRRGVSPLWVLFAGALLGALARP